MFVSNWFLTLIIVVYAISLMMYTIDFMKQNNQANKAAFRFVFVVWILQTIVLLYQFITIGNFSVLRLEEGLFFYAWIVLTCAIIVHFTTHIRFIVFFMNGFSFLIALLHFILHSKQEFYYDGPLFVHELLIVHITLVFVAYGLFTLSFILSSMYMFQYWLLKKKKGFNWLWRFSNLQKLDTSAFWSVVIGLPILLVSLISGFLWAYIDRSALFLLDLKTIGSLVIFLLYALFLVCYVVFQYRGKRIAMFNMVIFSLLLVNYFLTRSYSHFHTVFES